MRALMTVAALLLGLIGLFMSLCGGGFVLGALFNFRHPGTRPIAVIAFPCAIVGVVLIGASIRLVRRAMNRDDTDANR